MEKFSCPCICNPEHTNKGITNANTNTRFHVITVQWEETWTMPAYLDLPCVTDGQVNIISISICSCMRLRWLNTVLRAVIGNLRDSACFKLDKQTWRQKSNSTQMISQNLLFKIL